MTDEHKDALAVGRREGRVVKEYLEALRAYSDGLYGRLLALSKNNERYFLDKTPANSLLLPTVVKRP